MSDLSASAEGRAAAPALQILRVGTDISIPLDSFAEAVTGEVRIVDDRAEVDPKLAPVLALALDPVTDLALRLAGRTDAEEVLSEWVGAVSALLKWHRRSRRRITLCDIRTLADTTETLVARLGVTAEPSEPVAEDQLPQPADFDLIAAGVLLDSDTQAGALAEQLISSMIGPGRIAMSTALVRRIRVDRQALEARLKESARASEAEREQAAATLAKKEQGLSTLQAGIDRLTAERDLLRENLSLQVAAGEAAAAEIAAARGEAEAQKVKAARLEAALSEQEKAHGALRGEIERLATERDLLNENLGLQVADAASALAGAGARTAELTQVREALSTQERALAALRAEVEGTKTERDLLRENLGLQMEMFENPGTAEMEQEIADLRNRMVDFHLLKAENEAMERRLAEAQERQARREAVLTAQILLDGLPPWKA